MLEVINHLNLLSILYVILGRLNHIVILPTSSILDLDSAFEFVSATEESDLIKFLMPRTGNWGYNAHWNT